MYIYIYTFEFNYSLFIYKHSPARTGLNHRVSTLLVSLFLLAELMPPSSSTVGIPIKAPSLRMAPQLPTGALSVSTMQDEGGAADAWPSWWWKKTANSQWRLVMRFFRDLLRKMVKKQQRMKVAWYSFKRKNNLDGWGFMSRSLRREKKTNSSKRFWKGRSTMENDDFGGSPIWGHT